MTRPVRKERIDQLLTDRGLVESRSRAQAMILAGQVQVNGQRIDKAGTTVPVDADIKLALPDHPWVSRGGLKLDHAMLAWGIDPTGWRCLDVGASTGGFTDVLLTRGAREVVAVDVGTNQLAWKIRNDPRVEVHEQTNARTLGRDLIRVPVDLIVMDVSFISQRLIIPQFPALLKPEGQVIALIKPQFEASRGEVGKHGVVKDRAVWSRTIGEIATAYADSGFVLRGLSCSETPGPEGNREFLIWLGRTGESADLARLLEAALDRAESL